MLCWRRQPMYILFNSIYGFCQAEVFAVGWRLTVAPACVLHTTEDERNEPWAWTFVTCYVSGKDSASVWCNGRLSIVIRHSFAASCNIATLDCCCHGRVLRCEFVNRRRCAQFVAVKRRQRWCMWWSAKHCISIKFMQPQPTECSVVIGPN